MTVDTPPSGDSVNERVRDLRLVERALARAVRAALLRHKQAGNPVCEWRDGKVVWIAPEDIQIWDED
jgi:hypothetical protein